MLFRSFNRGPQGNVGIKCEKFGSGAKITDLSPDGPAFFCGKLAVGDVIESVDDKALRSLSLVEIVESLKGEAGSEITLYILNRGAAVEREGGRERERERERRAGGGGEELARARPAPRAACGWPRPRLMGILCLAPDFLQLTASQSYTLLSLHSFLAAPELLGRKRGPSVRAYP